MTMEVNYGVAVTNKFALFLNEDEDPLDILRLQEENKSKKVEQKKKPSPTDGGKDSKTKNKANKTDAVSAAAADQKKPTAAATTTTVKKDEKVPVRTKGKPAQGESVGVDKKPGKENDAPKRERRDEPGNRPRPQSGPARDAAPKEGFNRSEQGERGGFQGRPFRGPRPQRFERGGFVERGERPEFGSEKVEDGEGVQGGEFRRGGGRGRGGRGSGVGFRGGKREFDRHSGSDRSGVKPQDKRDGAGAHNWGNITDDIQEQLNANQTTEETATWGAQMEAANAQPTTEGAKPEDGDAEANPDVEAAEQEKVLTLDEWKAQQEALRLKSDFNIRKAGEGCAADPQWRKMVALAKKKDEDEEDEEEEEEEEDIHQGRHKTTLPIEIKFNQTARRGFGGRGRGRGGRGGGAPGEERRGAPEERPRGGPRGGREQKAPSLSDEHDFPSLGGVVAH